MNKSSSKLSRQYSSTINLNARGKNRTAVIIFAIVVVIIVAIVGAMLKFGVYDQLRRLDDAIEKYNGIVAKGQQLSESLADYGSIEKEYRTRCLDWLDNEKADVDRRTVLDLIERELMTRGSVKSISIHDSVLSIGMSDMNLMDISAMMESLIDQPIVASAVLNSAKTEKSNDPDDVVLDFSITIRLKPAESEVIQ